MHYDKVDLIAAVGRRGQLGLNGRLPWHDPEDLQRFAEDTTDCLLIAGWNTYQTVRTLHGIRGRRVYLDSSDYTPQKAWTEAARYTLRNVYVIGGAATYARWLKAGWIRRSLITIVDYDGPADVYMPSLWNHRALAGGIRNFPDDYV